ncbi:hypothetical protein [Thiomicrorhabdus xiamenensis]|uniref:Uncharacterized protein n=1 Tax=Thiomicrorhabdus xiamenensis TaxID=2739063 RepID=A0A7D4NQC1_9GAMM|nr:hypothetical protein [Thiomicrorhabdus xiamenensis]QKI88732.1 hypothetical protein HQN79_03705 [Thiomicrorhabdus xiamenensis]
MNLDDYIRDLKKRLRNKSVVSSLLMFQIIAVAFGTAGLAFSFDSLFNNEPEYLKYFDDEIWRLKDEFKESTAHIESLLSERSDEISSSVVSAGIKNNLTALAQESKGVASSIDGFANAFNERKYAIADSHFSSKRVLFLVFSFFVVFYIKFLVDLYRHNINQISHEQAILDALRLCMKSNDNNEATVNVEALKEVLPLLRVRLSSNDRLDPMFSKILNKVGGKA